jgi:ArsR family transcriptional regulator
MANGNKLPKSCQVDMLKKITNNLPKEEDLDTESEIFKALSDPTRLKIVHLLGSGELCVCEIMYALDKPQSTTSHHLNILKNAELIKSRKEGIWNHYQLKDPKLVEKLKIIKPKVD